MIKLAITLLSTVLLLVHMGPISEVADAAADPDWSTDALRGLRSQLVFQSGAALVVLLVATALSVYKPQGRTRFGWRKALS
ncbi:hypothetical protein [Saccharothrix sp. ST-888]|uniref:hypothetical protein n=1 Tax=Saccharothrix sp. ST-888 TaxID=1427391 RepID=UPI0018CEFA69|nr:hypothetical protein [Saccharothrix sp. ST-888]